MDISALKVFGDRVCVKKIITQSKSDGILMPSNNNQEEPCVGKIISIGNGTEEKQTAILNTLKLDNIILFQAYNAISIRSNGEMYYIIHLKDILAII